jgi:hypothetical protein
MRTLILALTLTLLSSNAFAQTEDSLVQYFEGKQVKVKMDMPSTKDGIDIYPESGQPLKLDDYATRLRQNGRGLEAGQSTMITRVKVKEKQIEIQLGGGGYGTLGDSLGTIALAPPVPKTDREKSLEREIKNTSDPAKRKELELKRDRLEDQRRSEQRILGTLAQGQRDAKKSQAEQKALETGSRFNIRFSRPIGPGDLSPDRIQQALNLFLEF